MKKPITWILTFVCLLGLVGCSRQPQEPFPQEIVPQELLTQEVVPQKQPTQEPLPQETLPRVQLPEDRSQPVELTAEAEQYITNLLDCLQWKEDTAHCEDEYLFCIDGKQFLYHDVCGTFRDLQSTQTAWISPKVREELNMLLGHERFLPAPPDKQYNIEVISGSGCIYSHLSSSYAAGQTVVITLFSMLHYVPRPYINGVLIPISYNSDDSPYFCFTMPCEDIRIEIKLLGGGD